MSSPAISNSLLRLDGAEGSPPVAFEGTDTNAGFSEVELSDVLGWCVVLELGDDDDAEKWCARTAETLQAHAHNIRRMQRAGATATLFVEIGPGEPVLRFTPKFLRVLAKAEIALECAYATETDC